MQKEKFIDLVVDNLRSGSTIPFYQFMFRNISILENLSYSDWLSILDRVKNSSLSLYSFLPFAYKFVGVNLIDRFLSFNDILPETKSYIIDSLDEKYDFLSLSSMDVSILRNYDGLIVKLVNLKIRLIGEGAVSVDKVVYTGGDGPPVLIELSKFA
jgi:hypothetical protein